MSLDVLKLIASYVVVFIHFKFSGLTGDIVDALARFAVPVFFMVSGYFAYSNSTEKIISKMKNIIKIYFWGAVIYFCFYGTMTLYDSGIKTAIWYGISYFNPVNVVKFIVFNVPRSSEHLWFLVALIYVYGLHYFIAKWKIKDSIYLWTGVVLLAIHLLLGVGLSSMGIVVPICVIRNFLFMGYPFYCIGMLIRKNEDLVHEKITYKRAMILILFGVIETVISYFICGGNELYIGSVLVAVALLLISLKTKDIQINEKVIKLSQTSTGIYLIHIPQQPLLQLLLRLRDEHRVLLYRRNHSRNHGVLCSSLRNRYNSVLLTKMHSNRRCSHTTARKIRGSPPLGNKQGRRCLLPGACQWVPRLTAVQDPNTNRIQTSSPCICVTTTG